MIIKKLINTIIIVLSLLFSNSFHLWASCSENLVGLIRSSYTDEVKETFSNIDRELKELALKPSLEFKRDFLSKYSIEELLRGIFKMRGLEGLSDDEKVSIERTFFEFTSFVDQLPEAQVAYKEVLNKIINENGFNPFKQIEQDTLVSKDDLEGVLNYQEEKVEEVNNHLSNKSEQTPQLMAPKLVPLTQVPQSPTVQQKQVVPKHSKLFSAHVKNKMNVVCRELSTLALISGMTLMAASAFSSPLLRHGSLISSIAWSVVGLSVLCHLAIRL